MMPELCSSFSESWLMRRSGVINQLPGDHAVAAAVAAAATVSCGDLFPPLIFSCVPKQAASMTSSFLYSRWFYPRHHSVDSVPSEEFLCPEEEEEEEEDKICWVLGKILCFYFLAVGVIKILYHGWIFVKNNGAQPLNCRVSCSKGKRDSCKFHCRFRICSLIWKLFGGEEQSPAHCPPASPSPKKPLKKSFSKLSQQTFCDSESSDHESLGSQVSLWKGSVTERERECDSTLSLKQRKLTARPRDAESHWVPELTCPHCKAKRTKEWLAQHFFEEDMSFQEKNN